MQVIAIGATKGGVGKTTLAMNLGAQLAYMGKKVCMLDMDPQANLSEDMGVDLTRKTAPSTMHILEPQYDSEYRRRYVKPESLVRHNVIKDLPTLDIIPASVLMQRTGNLLINEIKREFILRNYIQKYKEFFSQYDYILLDTHPSMTLIEINAFFAADSIILVAATGGNDVGGIDLFWELWRENVEAAQEENNIKAIIMNKFDVRNNEGSAAVAQIHEKGFGDFLIPVYVKAQTRLSNTTTAQKPICLWNDSEGYGVSAAKKNIEEVTKALIEKGVF